LGNWARRNVRIEKSWADGFKYLTGETRLVRAQTRFVNWLKRTHRVGVTNSVNHPNLGSFIHVVRGLADWQEQVSDGELEHLKKDFERTEKNPLQSSKARKRAPATNQRASAVSVL
jgi:hypothetical protein